MVDRYTKGILTIIAVALTIIAAQNVTRLSVAQLQAPLKVQLCDELSHCMQLTAMTLTENERRLRLGDRYGVPVLPDQR
jgi:hypothetical protein